MEADSDEALELGLGEDAELERALSTESTMLDRLQDTLEHEAEMKEMGEMASAEGREELQKKRQAVMSFPGLSILERLNLTLRSS